MRHAVLPVALSLVVGLCLAQRSAASEPMDKAAFGDFLAKMQATSQTAKLTDPNDPLFWTLRDQSYKEEALKPLRDALTTLPVSDTGVFVAGRILVPLAVSDVAVVRKAIPTVAAAQGRLVKYQNLPVFSKEQLKAMSLPPSPDPRASAETALKVLSDYAERRQKRLEAEGTAARINLQAMLLERTICEVMLRADRPAEDDRVMQAVSRAEQEKRITYKYALNAITAQAAQMDQARATRFYKALEKAGTAMLMVEGNYVDPSAIIFGTTANTVFRTPHCYPGVDMLTAANALAGAAKLPVLKVPSHRDVAGSNLLNNVKTLLSQGKPHDKDPVKALLARIIKECPGTAAAEEAARIQKGGGSPRRGG